MKDDILDELLNKLSEPPEFDPCKNIYQSNLSPADLRRKEQHIRKRYYLGRIPVKI
jgi:hypothetical protein